MVTNEVIVGILKKVFANTFPGAIWHEIEAVKQFRAVSTIDGSGGLEIGIKLLDNHRIRFERSQIFSEPERQYIAATIEQIKELGSIDPPDLLRLLAEKLETRIVARTISNEDNVITNTLSQVLGTLETWASETYEGGGISASFLIDIDDNDATGILFSDYIEKDFAKVLSNGFDSIVELTRNATIKKYYCPESENYADPDSWKCPHRYRQICQQTSGNNKIAILLNRNGEILVFRKNEMIFSKRRGAWLLFNHDTVLRKLAFSGKKFNETIRKSIYESALDVSFARCGGCVSYYFKTKTAKGLSIVSEVDLLSSGESKSRILSLVPKVFNTIERRIRQEIIGIDGATILDSEGHMIVAGAIIQYKAGSDGGGRSAAAKALSKYGVSLKISADGKITVYYDNEKQFSFA